MKRYHLILTSLLLSACVDNGYKPIAFDSNFGRSVTQITQAQLLNPQAAANPSVKVSKKMDGQVGQSVMSTYRTSFSQAEKVQNVTVNVSGGSGK